MKTEKNKKLAKKFAKSHRIVSNWSDLIDAKNDECQHHGDGKMSHNSEINVTINICDYCAKKIDCKMA